MSTIRLQVALAKAGIASRRKAAELIEEGRVKVNGRTVKERGARVEVNTDNITFDGKKIILRDRLFYYILNKPAGVLSTLRDERKRRTIVQYMPRKDARLFPVGRLDKDTTGLMILTNDGELTYRLTHPKFRIDRVYEAKVRGRVTAEGLKALERGVSIEGKPAKPEKIDIKRVSQGYTILFITIREGRKREVRRMLQAVGNHVIELKRLAYGCLKLSGLGEGETRSLTRKEISGLKRCVGL